MSRYRLAVVLSQAQGKNPVKRGLEESLTAALLVEPGLEVSIVPHLYDLGPDHTGRLFLGSVKGDMVVLSWLFPRAAFWLLDRIGVQGREGTSQLKSMSRDDEEEGQSEPPKGIGAGEVPDRVITCLDLRDARGPDAFVAEVRRLYEDGQQRAEEKLKSWVGGQPNLVSLGRYLRDEEPQAFAPAELLQAPERRWYPVIDYSRCTNCMECIDFCLFGVYGVDKLDRILVESQDNCKKGCPACSRVCPEHAIMFPDHKTPSIAGAATGTTGGLKIDLTKLFGGDDALVLAAQERDAELVKDGRQEVGLTVGVPKRQADRPQGPKDDLDRLVDQLDALDI